MHLNLFCSLSFKLVFVLNLLNRKLYLILTLDYDKTGVYGQK